jgi:type I restriction enzyme S subunit
LKHMCEDAGQYGFNTPAESYTHSGLRLLRTSDIRNDGTLRPAEEGVFVESVSDARFLLREGDLLLSRSGTVGRGFLVPCLDGPTTFAGFLVRFRPCGEVEPRFLAYAAASQPFQAAVMADAVTSTIQNFNAERYSNIKLLAPGLDEQTRIADFLDAETARIDDLVRVRRRLLDLTNERLGAYRDSALAQHPEVRWTPLHRLTNPQRPIVYGIVQAGEEVPEGVPYIKTGDLAPFVPEALSRTSREIDRSYRRARVRPGDIVIAMRASIGLAVVIPENLLVANLTQGTARIAPATNFSTDWMLQALACRSVQEECQVRAVGTTFKTLNIWDLRRISIPVLPTEEMRDGATSDVKREVERVLALTTVMNAQVERLLERRSALITAAVTGQLDVTTARGVA